MRYGFGLVGALIMVVVSARAEAAPPVSLPIEQHTLSNGMRVLFAPDPSLDDVTVIVRYDVGSSDDPAGKDGLAHLVEHLMFEGSKHVPKGEYYRWIERVGGWTVNAQTELDQTKYFVTVPPEALPVVLWLESDRMGFQANAIDQRALDHQRALVTSEVRDKVVDRNLGKVAEVALGEVFPPWHPYHRDHDPQWLEAITLGDVRAFLRTWYTPRNATLVVAGRFDPASTRALAEKYFGDLPAPAPPARPTVPAAWQTPDVRVDMGASMTRDTVVVAWPAPAFGQAGDAELDLAAAVLTDTNGRLQRELVHGGLAANVGAAERSFLRGSVFMLSATVADGSSPEDVVRSLVGAIERAGRDVTGEECARVRTDLTDTVLLRAQTSSGRAHWLVGAPSLAVPWDLTKYDALGPADVSGSVRRMLASGSRTVVVVHHDRRYPASGVVLRRSEGGR